MKKAHIIILLSVFSFSCFLKRKIPKKENHIALTLTSCNSFEVTNNNIMIGYLVKSRFEDSFQMNRISNYQEYIRKFEDELHRKYGNYYDKYYRAYNFEQVSYSNDSLLGVRILSPKQVTYIKNWNCETKGLEYYDNKYTYRGTKKKPDYFLFNYQANLFMGSIEYPDTLK